MSTGTIGKQGYCVEVKAMLMVSKNVIITPISPLFNQVI